MKKVVITLSIFLIISLIGNVILLMKLGEKNSNNELENTVEASNVPSDLIGTWTAKAGRKVEIFKMVRCIGHIIQIMEYMMDM